jgi:hypothetical protein
VVEIYDTSTSTMITRTSPGVNALRGGFALVAGTVRERRARFRNLAF